MKKETIVTAIVFSLVGFLAGYITNAQLSSSARQNSSIGGSPSPPSEAPGDSLGTSPRTSGEVPPGLPEGHPPINTGPFVQTLKDQAAKSPNAPVTLALPEVAAVGAAILEVPPAVIEEGAALEPPIEPKARKPRSAAAAGKGARRRPSPRRRTKEPTQG